MKRTRHARAVTVGREHPAYVDKPATPGRVYSKADIIARQLRGEPVLEGEFYGSRLGPDGLYAIGWETNAAKAQRKVEAKEQAMTRKAIERGPKRQLPPEAYSDSPIKCPNCRRIMAAGVWHQQGNRYACPQEAGETP